MIDFPWQEHGGGKSKRGADRHYQTVKAADGPDLIRSCPLWKPADHAHVYFWVTNTFLEEGKEMLKALGVRYVTNLPWIKEKEDGSIPRMGLGQYFRGGHELILFGVIGNGKHPSVMTKERDLSSVIIGPCRGHSVKPDEAYWHAEERTYGPRASIFARGPRFNWWSWGDEIGGVMPPRT